jgi:DNA-binding NarL/FixJ family response regulator
VAAPLPPEVDRSAFRIIQEAVTDVVRHAGVDVCRVTVAQADDALAIEVLDDGRGRPGNLGTGHGLTTFDDDDNVYGALRAGACGFLVKDMALDAILDAIRVVAAGDALLAPGVTRRVIENFTHRPRHPSPRRLPDGLTDRETEVLALVARGRSDAEIAGNLHITVATVKTYVSRLLAELNARDRVHLVIIAYDSGLVSATGSG